MSSFLQQFPQLGAAQTPSIPDSTRAIVINENLARDLGIEASALQDLKAFIKEIGAETGQEASAMAYSGHQFGVFNPLLGDGRAHLIAELQLGHQPEPQHAYEPETQPQAQRGAAPSAKSGSKGNTKKGSKFWGATAARSVDLHLKGSGRTLFSRPGADGKAPLAAMLREWVIGESLHGLGIPTSRILAVYATGEYVAPRPVVSTPEADRVNAGLLNSADHGLDEAAGVGASNPGQSNPGRAGAVMTLPQAGAIAIRVAASHLRVGTFEYAKLHLDDEQRLKLISYALERHYPEYVKAGPENRSAHSGSPKAHNNSANTTTTNTANTGTTTTGTTTGTGTANAGLSIGDEDTPALRLLKAVAHSQARLVAKWMGVGFVHGVLNTDNMTISGESLDFGPCAFMDKYNPHAVFSSIDTNGRYNYQNQPGITQWNLMQFANSLLDLIDPNPNIALELAQNVLDNFADIYQEEFTRVFQNKLGYQADLGEILEHLRNLTATHSDFTSHFRAINPGNPIYIPRNWKLEAMLQAVASDSNLSSNSKSLKELELLVQAVSNPFIEQEQFSQFKEQSEDTDFISFCGT